MTNLGERIFRWLTDWGISSNSAKGRELWKLSDEATTLEATNTDLLEALEAVTTEYVNMCEIEGMCNDPHTLGTINKAQSAIRRARHPSLATA